MPKNEGSKEVRPTDFDLASLPTQDEPEGMLTSQQRSIIDWVLDSKADSVGDAEKYAEAEQAAFKLVGVLRDLRTRSTSYETATRTLEGVRQHLVGLIASTEKTSYETQKAWKAMCESGGPQILERLAELEKRIGTELSSVSQLSRRVNTLIGVTIACAVLWVILGIAVLVN